MRLIGLTGGIASGKSTAARFFRERGVSVIDADRLARELVEPGQPALALIAARWPEVVPGGPQHGALDRAALARQVFADPGARQALEAILHPRIQVEARRRAAQLAAAGEPYVLYEAALIFETGKERELDGVILVATSLQQQRQRLAERDGLGGEEIERRLAAQLPLEKKRPRARWVLENDGGEESLRSQVAELDAQLRTGGGHG